MLVHHISPYFDQRPRTVAEWLAGDGEALTEVVYRFEIALSRQRLMWEFDHWRRNARNAITDPERVADEELQRFLAAANSASARVVVALRSYDPDSIVTVLQIIELCLWEEDVVR